MHNVKRIRQSPGDTEAKKAKEKAKLKSYLELQTDVLARKRAQDYSPAALALTTQLLSTNPEFATVWNYRRHILQRGLFPSQSSPKDVYELLKEDLALTTDALRRHPKVYWIWNHRTWCLDSVPDKDNWRVDVWGAELAVVERMLDADARNFQAWNYRRFVLESHPAPPTLRAELKYTTKKITANFSNFSAWHQRCKVLAQLWERGELDEAKSREEEFTLLRNAMYTDPNDQSVWMYHRWLMGSHPSTDLLLREISAIQELADEAPDSKWCLQSIFHYKSLLLVSSSEADKSALLAECRTLLDKLKEMDPLRKRRYDDLAKSLTS